MTITSDCHGLVRQCCYATLSKSAHKWALFICFLRKHGLYVNKWFILEPFYWLLINKIMQNLRFCEKSLYKYRDLSDFASQNLKTALPRSFLKNRAKSQILRKSIASRRSMKIFIFEEFFFKIEGFWEKPEISPAIVLR